MTFSGKVVIVTGAASGIGAATAELFAKEGATVAMVDKDETNLRLAEKQNVRNGRNTFAITANVANDDDVKRIIKETIDKCGRLDILVNNAGLIRYGGILDGKLMQSFDDMVNVNLRAMMQMASQAAVHLIKTKGNIVNLASVSATYSHGVEFVPYSITKAGVKHFTRGAALELAPHGVRVNSVSPGPVRTNIMGNSGLENVYDEYNEKTALKRICEPVEVADLVIYLASDKAKGITGTDIIMDNGFSLK